MQIGLQATNLNYLFTSSRIDLASFNILTLFWFNRFSALNGKIERSLSGLFVCSSELEIYKRKILRKNVRKHAFDQEKSKIKEKKENALSTKKNSKIREKKKENT